MQPVTDGARTPWFVYLIECRNGSLYTGISNDVTARYVAHASGKGARYTRANPPVRLMAVLVCADRAEASRQEYAIKRLSPKAKRALCINNPPGADLLTQLAGLLIPAPKAEPPAATT